MSLKGSGGEDTMEGEQELIDLTNEAMESLVAKVRRWRKKHPEWSTFIVQGLVQTVANEHLSTMDEEAGY